MQTKTLIAALFAGSAFGSGILPRQTDAAASACSSIIKSIPTPPSALVSALAKNPATDLCKFSVPASLSKEFGSYTSSISSFFDKNKGQLTKCPGFSQIKSQAPIDCKAAASTTAKSTSGSATAKTTAGAKTTGTGTTASAQQTGTSSSKAGAARETGMVMAAVAAAGFALAAL